MLEIKIGVAINYPQLDCPISEASWSIYARKKLKEFERRLANTYNGFTKYRGQGAYSMRNGVIVFEKSITYISYAASTEPIIEDIEFLKDSLYQESILLVTNEIEGMEFI